MKINYRFYLRRVLLGLFSCVSKPMPLPSEDEIDVIIPVAKKDLKILPLCLEGVRKNVTNKIKSIYIVAAQDDYIKQFCAEHDTVFVDETSVLGFGPSDLNLVVRDNMDRSGWLFQQFIKLSGTIGTCENYLCIDSDHILIRPHTFLTQENVPVFYMSAEYCKPYYVIIKKITSIRRLSHLSYVSHKMIFNKREVANVKKEIEYYTNKTWYQGILDNYDRNEGAGFSEFELYGNFASKKKLRPWEERQLSYNQLKSFKELCELYKGNYSSLTFPDYAK